MSSSTQLSFSLRVSSGVKSVHLLGSWDNYVGQLSLSKDRAAAKSGSWTSTFRFRNAVLEPGRRYWYYYIVDGYHVAHNPGVASMKEPTTGRELNVLDVRPGASPQQQHDFKPKSKSSSSSHRPSSSSKSSSSSSRHHSSSLSRDRGCSSRGHGSLSLDIPKGRPLSASQIKAPKPVSPHTAKHILDQHYDDGEALAALKLRLGRVGVVDAEGAVGHTDFGASPVSSTGSSLSYHSDGSSSAGSSRSGYSTPASDCSSCICERYGITRKGERVKLDCGGMRCGYGDADSDANCSSDDGAEYYARRSARRNGIVVR